MVFTQHISLLNTFIITFLQSIMCLTLDKILVFSNGVSVKGYYKFNMLNANMAVEVWSALTTVSCLNKLSLLLESYIVSN